MARQKSYHRYKSLVAYEEDDVQEDSAKQEPSQAHNILISNAGANLAAKKNLNWGLFCPSVSHA